MARALEGLKITEISAETAKDKQEDEFADFYKNKYSDGRRHCIYFVLYFTKQVARRGNRDKLNM